MSTSTSTIDRLLDHVAGFHASETEARHISAEMLAATGVLPSQVVVLSPADATWLQFRRRRRQWARSACADGQGLLGDPWLMAALGGLAAALLGGVWLSVSRGLESGLGDGWGLGVFAAAVMLCALAGQSIAARSRRTPQHLHFDAIVRRQLGSGRWVVLVHGFRWQQQSGVVSLLARENGLGWCAVASSRPLL